MKVLATGPLAGCAGTDPGSPLPGGSGGTALTSAGGSNGLGSAGSASSSGGSASSNGGNAFTSSGSASGGNAFVGNGGGSSGFSFSSAGTSAGTGTGSAGAAGSSGATGSAGSSGNTGSLTAAGNVSAVPLGSLVIAAGIFFLGRDAKGLYAMSMQCTHRGCAVVFSGNQLDCPCHHSRFDSNGNVLVGPATTPLPHFALVVDAAGNISVDRYTVVSASTRTPV